MPTRSSSTLAYTFLLPAKRGRRTRCPFSSRILKGVYEKFPRFEATCHQVPTSPKSYHQGFSIPNRNSSAKPKPLQNCLIPERAQYLARQIHSRTAPKRQNARLALRRTCFHLVLDS